MRIGVYIDGFNLYYGARALCGRGTPGWRWLDLRGLAADLVSRPGNWAGAQVERVVYCTARIDGAANPSGHADQDVYLEALVAAGSVDHIEFGTYVAHVKTAPLAKRDPQGRPELATLFSIFEADVRAVDLRATHPLVTVPVGVINPSPGYLAGDLRGNPATGAGRHWWARLSCADLKNHQFPDPVGPHHRPDGW